MDERDTISSFDLRQWAPSQADPPPAADVAAQDDGWPPPILLDRFALLGRLGRGGEGTVWRVFDRQRGIQAALKLYGAGRAPGSEAEHLQLAKGRHFAQVYEVVLDGPAPYLLMEFVEGRSLRDRLAEEPLGFDEFLGIAEGIAEGLQAVHGLDDLLAHLDLKPSNIMLGSDGVVKLIDFGLAMAQWKRCPDGRWERRGPAPAPSGTPGFRSPEQLRQQHVSKLADIWSFGVVLFFSLTRTFPVADDALENDRLVREQDGGVRMHLLSEVPGAVRSLIAGCLRFDQRRRYQDIGDVLNALRSVRGAGGDHAVHNISGASEPMIGRVREKEFARQALVERRVLVLHGVHGVGKSRVAREIAREAASRRHDWSLVCLIRLGDSRLGDDPPALRDAICSELEKLVPGGSGVVRGRSPSRFEALLGNREPGRALVLLDNADGSIHALRCVVEELLAADREVHVVVTGRAALLIEGSRSLRIEPLSLEGGFESEACRMFLAKAQEAQHGLRPGQLRIAEREEIVSICAAVDGLPLAIAHLAAWMGRESTAGILAMASHLDDLHQMITRSVAQLGPAAERLLARLSVFEGGWSQQLARDLCAEQKGSLAQVEGQDLDAVHRLLLNQDLVRWDRQRRRYLMLRPVRDVARSRATALGEQERTEQRLLECMVELVDPTKPRPEEDPQQRFDRLEQEFANVRKALLVSLERSGDPAMLALMTRLASRLGYFFWTRGRAAEGRRLLERALLRARASGERLAVARIANALGMVCLRGDAGEAGSDEAHHTSSRAFRLSRREFGALRKRAGADHQLLAREAQVLHNLQIAERKLRRFSRVERLLRLGDRIIPRLPESVARSDIEWIFGMGAAVLAKERGDLDDAERRLLALPSGSGSPQEIARAANIRQNLGEICCLRSQHGQAEEHLSWAARGFARSRNRPERVRNFAWRARVAEGAGDHVRSSRLFGVVRRCTGVAPLEPFHGLPAPCVPSSRPANGVGVEEQLRAG
jgi:predicted ATPase